MFPCSRATKYNCLKTISKQDPAQKHEKANVNAQDQWHSGYLMAEYEVLIG